MLGALKRQEAAEMEDGNIATAELLKDSVVIWKSSEWKTVFEEKYFGKVIEEEKKKYLLLSLPETMLLLEREHITLKKGKKTLSFDEFYKICCEIDAEFPHKYAVYRDLRNRGYIVKSGFKFGTHFRVYDRGVNPYKGGQKILKEHTKFNVHAVSESHSCSYAEWSRYVRLSQNIRAKALLAVVDAEGDVTYYNIVRMRP